MLKRGSRSLPSEKVILSCKCSAATPLYTHNGKKYINFKLPRPAVASVKDAHQSVADALVTRNVQDPLSGDVLKVKIPWKGRNPICSVVGEKTLSGLVEGDQVKVGLEFCGAWIISDFSGTSWKLISLEG